MNEREESSAKHKLKISHCTDRWETHLLRCSLSSTVWPGYSCGKSSAAGVALFSSVCVHGSKLCQVSQPGFFSSQNPPVHHLLLDELLSGRSRGSAQCENNTSPWFRGRLQRHNNGMKNTTIMQLHVHTKTLSDQSSFTHSPKPKSSQQCSAYTRPESSGFFFFFCYFCYLLLRHRWLMYVVPVTSLFSERTPVSQCTVHETGAVATTKQKHFLNQIQKFAFLWPRLNERPIHNRIIFCHSVNIFLYYYINIWV